MKILNKRNMISSAVIASVLLVSGCGGGGGSSSSGTTSTPSQTETKNYTIYAVDDPVRSATVKASECKGFEEGTDGYYTLTDCSSKPVAIAVEGGYVDLDGDGQKDDDETSMGMPLLLNTSQTDELTISPLTTLVANLGVDESIDELANSLGLTKEDLFKKPDAKAGLQDVLRTINSTLIQAKELGIEDSDEFLKDFRASIKEANTSSSSTTSALDRIKNAQNKIAQKAKEGEYIKKYGVVFSGFVSETNTQTNSTEELLKSIANKNKVSSNKVVFSGFIYDDIIKNADIKLFYIDKTSGAQIEVGGAEIEDGADDLTDTSDTGKWKITVDETILETDQVLIFEGTADVEKEVDGQTVTVKVKLNTAISTVVLRELYKNKINTADLKDITITNVTTAKLSLLKLLDDEILKKPEAIIENKKTIEQNPNLKEVLKTTAAAVKAVIDKDATLEVKENGQDVAQENTEEYSNEVAKTLLIKVYGSEVLDEEDKKETTQKVNLDTNLKDGIKDNTKVTENTLDETKKEIEEDKTLNDQLSSTDYEKFKVTTDMLSQKELKVRYDDNSGVFVLKLFSDNTFIKTFNAKDIYVGKWSITSDGNLSLAYTTGTSSEISFSSLGLLAKGSLDGSKTFEVQGINTLDENEQAPLVEFTENYISNNDLYVISSNSVVKLSTSNTNVSSGKLLYNSKEYSISSVTEQIIYTKDTLDNGFVIYLNKSQADNTLNYETFLSAVTSESKTISLDDIYSTNTGNSAQLDNSSLKFEINPLSLTSKSKSIGTLSYVNDNENALGAKTTIQITSINANSTRQRSYLANDYLLEGCSIGSSKELRVFIRATHNKIKLMARFKDSEEIIVDKTLVEESTLNNNYEVALYIKDNIIYAYVNSNDSNSYFATEDISSNSKIDSTLSIKKLNKYHVGASLYNNSAESLYQENDILNSPVKGLIKKVSTLVGNSTNKLTSTVQSCSTTAVLRDGITLEGLTLTSLENPYTYTNGVWGVQTDGNTSENSASFANGIYSLKAVSTSDARSRTKIRFNTNESNVVGYQSTLKLNTVGDNSAANQRIQMVLGYNVSNSTGGKGQVTIGITLKESGIYAWSSLWDDVNNTELVSDFFSSSEAKLAETSTDFLEDEFTIATWIGVDKKLYININGQEKSFDMTTWDLKGYTLNSQAYKFEGRADIRYGSDTTQTIEGEIKDVSYIKGDIAYIPEAPASNLDSILTRSIDWNNSEEIDFINDLSAGKYANAIGQDLSLFLAKHPLYELEYEIWSDNHVDIEKSELINNNGLTTWNWYKESINGTYTLETEVLGAMKFTQDGTELVVDQKGKHYRLKYLGEIDSSTLNSSSKTIFPTGSKAYGVIIKTTADSYDYEEKVETHGNTSNTYYTSFDEFISNQSGEHYFKRYELSTSQNRGVSFSTAYSSGDTSGTLVETIDSVVQAGSAGTWSISNNSDLETDILTINITATGYSSDNDDNERLYAIDNGTLYKIHKDSAGKEFGGYFFDEASKNAFKSKFAISSLEVVNKTISTPSDYTNDTLVYTDSDTPAITISGLDISKVYMTNDSNKLYVAIDRAGLDFPPINEYYNYWIYFEGNNGHKFSLENFHDDQNNRFYRIYQGFVHENNSTEVSETQLSADKNTSMITMEVPLSVLSDSSYEVSLYSHSTVAGTWQEDGEIQAESKFNINISIPSGNSNNTALDSNLYPTIDWDANNIEFTKYLAAGTFDSKTALDPLNFILGSPYYEFEYEDNGDEEELRVSKLSFSISNLTDVSLNFESSINGEPYVSDNDPVLGGDEFSLSNNVLTLSNNSRNLSVKFVENDVSSSLKFNDVSNEVFASTAKSYALVIKVNSDSYGFYDKLKTNGNIANNVNQEFYTSLNEYITNHNGGIINHENEAKAIAFASGSTGTSGTLVEISTSDSSIVPANAGTWDIVTNTDMGRDILTIRPSISGYNTDRYLKVYTVKDSIVYKGELQKAGVEESIIVHNSQAKDDFETKFMPGVSINNTFGGESLANKTFYQVFFGDGLDGNNNTINDVAVIEQVTIDAQGNTTVTSILNSTNGTGVSGVLDNKFYQKGSASADFDLSSYNEYVSGDFQSGCIKTNYAENNIVTDIDFFFTDESSATSFASTMTANTTDCP